MAVHYMVYDPLQFPMLSGHIVVPNWVNRNMNAIVSGSLQGGAIEGWRAMPSIALKARKRPFNGDRRSTTGTEAVTPNEANGSTESFATPLKPTSHTNPGYCAPDCAEHQDLCYYCSLIVTHLK